MSYKIFQIETIYNNFQNFFQNKYKNIIIYFLIATYTLILQIPKIITIREILFFLIFLITIIDFFMNKEKLNFKDIKIWVLYLFISLISLTYTIDFLYSLQEIKREILYPIMIIFIISYWFKKDKDFLKLLNILILGNLLFAIVSIYQIVHLLIDNFHAILYISPFKMGFGNFSTYIILMLPLILASAIYHSKQNIKISIFLIMLLVLNIICLYFTSNRMGWISLLVETITILMLMYGYGFLRSLNKKIILLTLSIMIFLSVIAIVKVLERADNSNLLQQLNTNHFQHLTDKIYKSILNDPRYPIWEVAINNITEKPLTGGGFGREAFKLRNPEFSQNYPHGWHAHNMFLNKAVQMGIPGMIIFSLLFVFLIRRLIIICNHLKNEKQRLIFPIVGIIATFGILTKNLTDDFFVRDQALLFWIIMTAIISTFDYDKKAITDKKNNA